MQDSQIPIKFSIVFASSASAGDVTSPIPTTAQPGGLVSLPTGWQEINFTPVTGGGVPPWGKDFNGLFQVVTAWLQWYQAGGPVTYDATFQAAVGGYPLGAIVQSATTPAKYWRSTTDNNVTNPDTGGAGWAQWPFPIPIPIADGGTNNIGPFTMGSIVFSDGSKLSQNNANFYWLDSLQRLGIRTNAPNNALDVRGSGAFTGMLTTTSADPAVALAAPNGGLSVGGNAAVGGSLVAGGIVETTSGSSTALYAPNGGIAVGGNAQIGGGCFAAGGTWTGNLDIISNVPGTGIAVVSTTPVIELQTGPGSNTWVWGHDLASADTTWSFNNVSKMRLDQFGNLTIQGIYATSDIALKQNIRDMEPTLARLSRVRPVSFEYKGQPGERKLGVIAQELQAEFPELVRASEDGTLTVAYDKLTAVLLGAVRELSAEVAALRASR